MKHIKKRKKNLTKMLSSTYKGESLKKRTEELMDFLNYIDSIIPRFKSEIGRKNKTGKSKFLTSKQLGKMLNSIDIASKLIK